MSLRDLTVDAILGDRNIVDDADHVCRERTSLHLAELATGDREFIAAPIGALLRDPDAARPDPQRVTVYSPFGLGVLDLALAGWVKSQAEQWGFGVKIDEFLPAAAPAAPVPVTASV